MNPSLAARNAAPLSIASLADHLRDGPLACLADLQTKAAQLSRAASANDGQQLEQLAEVVQLSQCAMQRFHAFTRDLATLVDDLAARATERH